MRGKPRLHAGKLLCKLLFTNNDAGASPFSTTDPITTANSGKLWRGALRLDDSSRWSCEHDKAERETWPHLLGLHCAHRIRSALPTQWGHLPHVEYREMLPLCWTVWRPVQHRDIHSPVW